LKKTLNLLPSEYQPVKRKGKIYYAAFALGLYVLIILTFWAFNIITVKRLDPEINRLKALKQEMQRQLSFLQPAAPETIEGAEILEAIKTTPPWDRILAELSLVVPDSIWLTLIESKETREAIFLGIKGFSETQVGIAELISRLEASPYFYEVEIVFSQKGEEYTTFELRTKIKWT
jgi:Tfp pilus assembly protein PilN